MVDDVYKRKTKDRSTTFYYASLFFPRERRNDVFKLYAFLRTADDIVDENKDKNLFLSFKKEVYDGIENETFPSKDPFIGGFLEVYRKYRFEREYIDSFFASLEYDFKKPLQIKDQAELQKYVYGVAGVVGLMMAKILGLEPSYYNAARKFGELMQIVNIIRDIKFDYDMYRIYIPKSDIERFGLSDISDYKENKKRKGFEELLRFEIGNVLEGINSLSGDIEKIPKSYRRPIEISRDVYKSIANEIYKSPTLVWRKKIRLDKLRFFLIILKNLF